MSVEVRVGGFLLAALVVLIGFVLMLGDISLTPGFRVYVDYAYAGGLQAGAPVKLSGVRVGKVAEVALLGSGNTHVAAYTDLGRVDPPVVRARLELNRDAAPLLTDHAKLYVGTQGIIGETYVEFEPAPGSPVQDAAVLRGVDAPKLHVVALQLAAIVNTLGLLADLSGPTGIVQLTGSLKEFIDTANGVARDHQAELAAIVVDGAAMAADMRVVASKVRTAVADGDHLTRLLEDSSSSAALVRAQLPELLDRARHSVGVLDDLTTRAQVASNTADLTVLVQEFKTTLDNLNQTSLDARAVMDTIRRGQGSLGGFVADKQVYEDLKALLADLKHNPWKMLWRE